MKDDIHPDNYRPVIFLDTSSDERFLLSSTVETNETAEWEDGEEYPLARVEMSSASHPFYTGVERTVDTAGRVEKFKARFKKAQPKGAASAGDSSNDAEDDDGTADESES
jgi:large subunit ribosomal protein L31